MITSLDNKKVKDWTKLHNKKYRNEEYLIFNPLAIKEGLLNGNLLHRIFIRFRFWKGGNCSFD